LHWMIHSVSCLYKCRYTFVSQLQASYKMEFSSFSDPASSTECTVQCLPTFTCSEYWWKFSGKITKCFHPP
jgi:hypothetical protein